MTIEGPTLFAIGTALVVAGGVTTLAMLTKAGAMGRGSKAFDNLRAFFQDESKAVGRAVMIVAAVLTVLGLMMTLSARRDREPRSIGETPDCRDACANLGYETGVVRGNPHTGEPPTPSNRRCYCRCEDGSWAATALGAEASARDIPRTESEAPCP